MIMTIACKTITVASTTALLGLFALCPSSVDAATTFWDLEFFDEGENTIGTGWFGYDDSSPLEQDFYPDGDDPSSGEPPLFSIDASDNWFLVDRFFAEIQGVTWQFDSPDGYLSWIPPQSDTYPTTAGNGGLANVAFSRFGEPSIGQDWLLGDAIDLPFLTLWTSGGTTSFLQATSEGAAFGSWTAMRRSDGNSKDVPEGSTTLAGLISLGLFVRLKQRSRHRRSRNWQQND
ncbi:MAG: hypothetical protein WA882_09320 [Geitlerinemataceae cyanobacterium]